MSRPATDWARTFEDLTDDVPTYSVRDVQAKLRDKLGSAGIDQVAYLGAAGVLGRSYTSSIGAFYERRIVDALCVRPHVTRENLGALPSLAKVEGVVIIRQRPLELLNSISEQRPFAGTHAQLFDKPAGSQLRKAIDDATRMYWRIAPARRADIWQHIAKHGYCPLVVTIGKWCLGGRNITDLSVSEVEGYEGRTVFQVEDAGPWARDLRHTWVDSGNGPAALWTPVIPEGSAR